MKFKLFLYFFALLLVLNSVHCQTAYDKVVLLDSLKRTITSADYDLKRVIKNANITAKTYKFYLYNKQNLLVEEGFYDTNEFNKYSGEFIFYYKNGTKRELRNYQSGKVIGLLERWYENGNLKEQGQYDAEREYKLNNYWNEQSKLLISNGNGHFVKELENYREEGNYKDGFKEGEWLLTNLKNKSKNKEYYASGQFLEGIFTDNEGSETKYDALEVKPVPKSGLENFYKFIGKSFRVTNEASKNKVRGRILVSFVIDKEGKLIEPKIVKGLGFGLNEEAIRVVSNSELWTPGMQRGKNVRVQYALPISIDTTR